MKKRFKKTLIASSLLFLTSVSFVSLTGCNKTQTDDPIILPEPVVEVTNVSITNKTALQAEWKVGSEARTMEVSILPTEANVTTESALSSGDLVITSSDTQVVTVSTLTLTALSEGTVTITASYKGTFTDSVELTILPKDPLDTSSISTLESFVSTFNTKMSEASIVSYGVVRTQTTLSTQKVTTNQIAVSRTKSEALVQKDDLTTYGGILGDDYFYYGQSSYGGNVDYEVVTEDNKATVLEKIETLFTTQLEGGSSLTSGDLGIYFKYDSSNTLHGLIGEYEVTSSTENYTVTCGFYIDPASTSYGTGATLTYTYILNSDFLPVKVDVSRVYVNSSNWDFEKHTVKEDGTATFTHETTFINFKYGELSETNSESPLFDVTPYFVSSLDKTKVHATKLNSSTWSYETVTELMVGDNFNITLDDGAYLPETALDSIDIYVTGTSDANVISVEDDGYGGTENKAVGVGSATITIGTSLYPNLASLTLTVVKNPNVGTSDDPVEAYYSSFYNPSEHFEGSYVMDYDTWTSEYVCSGATFTVGETVEEVFLTNQTGVVSFASLNSKFNNDSSIITIEAKDYSNDYIEYGDGYFSITFTPIKAGTTSFRLYKDATTYSEIPITVNAA